jgi:hypothetical protein
MDARRSEPSAILEVEGMIQHIDATSRTLTLLVSGAAKELIVPPDCLIRVNGERVKFRLLQVGDRAVVGYSFVGETAFAHSIRVHWLPLVVAAARARNNEGGVSLPDPSCRPDGKEGLS